MPFVFTVLETDRLLLRPIAPSDLQFVFQHFSDPVVNRFLFDDDPVTTVDQAQEIIDFYCSNPNAPYNRWVIVRRDTEQSIGTCGFHKWHKRFRKCEIGYDLSPNHWGHGYMAEAVRCSLRFAFDAMGVNRVEALVYPDNLASFKVLERFRFLREGLLRQSICSNDTFYDHILLALLKQDFKG